jgi:hypothetical protein
MALSAAIVSAATACGGGAQDGASKTATSTPVATGLTKVPRADERVTLRGTLTLDGAPLVAEFLGVRVTRGGLAAACQYTIPAVTRGGYEIKVVADAEVRGCGAPGAEILLWAYVQDSFIFSNEAVPWPGGGATATFDASFSSKARGGASKPATEFKGHLFDGDGSELPGGTMIEVFVGDVRCGVTSLRYGDEFEGYYTLIVAGPESISGCGKGARLTFRINGKPAVEAALNDLGRGSEGHELNLTVE